jgi:hypothetical protein
MAKPPGLYTLKTKLNTISIMKKTHWGIICRVFHKMNSGVTCTPLKRYDSGK